MSLLLPTAAFAAVCVLFSFTCRWFNRTPEPSIARKDLLVMLIAFFFTTSLTMSFGFMVAAAMAFPLPLWADGGIAVGIAVLAALAVSHFTTVPRPA